MKCKKLFSILFACCMSLSLWAQQGMTAAGGDFAGSDGGVSYSLGQVFYQSISGSEVAINEGVQQPYETLSVSIFQPKKNEIEISIFPNPTAGRLNIAVEEMIGYDLRYQITDFNGQLWEENQLNSTRTRIELQQLPPAPYLLQIWQDNQLIQSSKIIKN
jgi:hypothetical protein